METNLAGARILIVDEVESNILFFQVILNDLGIKDVFTSTSPLAALELVQKEKISFIITAWEMDILSGTLFVQKARGNRRTKRLPFLIYSKRLQAAEVRLISELGMANVLGLPFDRIKATSLVKEMLSAESLISKEESKLRKMEDLLLDCRPSECLKFIGPDMSKKGPHLTRYKTLLAEAWVQIGQHEKGLNLIQEVLAIDPDFTPAKYLRSRIHSILGEHEQAILMLKGMIDSSPLNLVSKVNLGSAFADADQLGNAKAVLNEVLELDEDCRIAKDELGKIAFKEGDLPLAGKLLAETENGDFLARYFNSMGISLVAQKQFEKGVETYRNAISILATKAKLHLLNYNLGLAHRKKGDLKVAFKILAEVFINTPSFEKAYATLVGVNKEMQQSGLPIDTSLVQKIKMARDAHQLVVSKSKLNVKSRKTAA